MNHEELKLIDAWLDDDLSDEGAVGLEAWLQADQANLEAFVRASLLNRRLRDYLLAQTVSEQIEEDGCPTLDEEILAFAPPPETKPDSGTFIGGPVFSYMVATLVMAVIVLSAWAYKITHNQQPAPESARHDATHQEETFVGRITGMKDCRWSNPETGTYIGASASLGREYALASGLMEITYASEAKVILEGPCTYKVESDAGGFLKLGKLTANISGQKVKGANPKSPNPQSPTPNPFVVTTPTAIVTDLGTEFGVEVAKNGATETHVIQGEVNVQALDPDGSRQRNITVKAGDAVRIDPVERTIIAVPFAAGRFARRLTNPSNTRAETAYFRAIMADKPLGYWPLNEPAGARKFSDRSGNGFHGYAMGYLRAGAEGPLPGDSRAVEFKQKGYIDLGRHERFSLESGFSVEAWVWVEKQPSYGGPTLFAISGNSRHGRSGWLITCVSKVPQEVQVERKAKDIKESLRTWGHVVFVFDNDSLGRCYRNGKLQGEFRLGKPFEKEPMWGTIGWDPASKNAPVWQGRLAHVAVYDSMLDQRQIVVHYRTSKQSESKNIEE